MQRIKVKLLHATPLWLCSNAIRMSHNNHHLSDSYMINQNNTVYSKYKNHIGKKDLELIHRVGNKLKHKSVLEQIVLFFEIDGISRACLQELARHRTARLTVKSTRYTLKELKNETKFSVYTSSIENKEDIKERISKYIVLLGNDEIDAASIEALENIRKAVKQGISNDIAKYSLPESFRTKLQWQIDMRNFQNFLELRLAKDAHFEIRHLAQLLLNELPKEYQEIANGR